MKKQTVFVIAVVLLGITLFQNYFPLSGFAVIKEDDQTLLEEPGGTTPGPDLPFCNQILPIFEGQGVEEVPFNAFISSVAGPTIVYSLYGSGLSVPARSILRRTGPDGLFGTPDDTRAAKDTLTWSETHRGYHAGSDVHAAAEEFNPNIEEVMAYIQMIPNAANPGFADKLVLRVTHGGQNKILESGTNNDDIDYDVIGVWHTDGGRVDHPKPTGAPIEDNVFLDIITGQSITPKLVWSTKNHQINRPTTGLLYLLDAGANRRFGSEDRMKELALPYVIGRTEIGRNCFILTTRGSPTDPRDSVGLVIDGGDHCANFENPTTLITDPLSTKAYEHHQSMTLDGRTIVYSTGPLNPSNLRDGIELRALQTATGRLADAVRIPTFYTTEPGWKIVSLYTFTLEGMPVVGFIVRYETPAYETFFKVGFVFSGFNGWFGDADDIFYGYIPIGQYLQGSDLGNFYFHAVYHRPGGRPTVSFGFQGQRVFNVYNLCL